MTISRTGAAGRWRWSLAAWVAGLALWLSGAAPSGALPAFPFPPFGQADPALLREEGEEPVEPLAVAGRLLAENGNAITGAELVLVPVPEPGLCIWRDNRVNLVARSDEQGRFRFDGADPRDWAQLSVSAWGFVPADFDLGHLRDRVFPTEYRLGRSGSVRLRAVDRAGRAVTGAFVGEGEEGNLERLAFTLTGDHDPDSEFNEFTAARAAARHPLRHRLSRL